MLKKRSKGKQGLTVKQELFCQKYFELGDASKAYRAAYDTKGSDSSVWRNAHALLNNIKVARRIEELRQKYEKKAELSVERVIKEYQRLAFLDPRKLYDQDGNPLPIHELDDDTAAGIAGMELETEVLKARKINENGEDEGDEIQQEITRTRKIKLADKKGALDSLARHLAMFKDKVTVAGDKDNPVGGPVTINTFDMGKELADILTLEQLEELQRRALAKSNA